MNCDHTSRSSNRTGSALTSAGSTSLFLHFMLLLYAAQQPHRVLAFVAPSSSSSSAMPSFIRHSSSSSSSSSSSTLHENKNSLILSSDSKAINQQLNEAFSSLNDKDKYETVLTGLCAKIIDGGEKNANRESLNDPMRLLEEMNSSGITAGPRGVIGLIDVRSRAGW